jgi:hypothetical protein
VGGDHFVNGDGFLVVALEVPSGNEDLITPDVQDPGPEGEAKGPQGDPIPVEEPGVDAKEDGY